jgi:hypothetical protein
MIIKSNFIPIELYNKFIGDDILFRDKPISIFNDYIPNVDELSVNPYNVLVIMEPNQLFGLHNWAIQNSHLFSYILTWGSQILEVCSNSILLPFGSTFLHTKDKYKELASLDKRFEVTYLCGVKSNIEGQKLRQRLYSIENRVTTPKRWYYTVDGPKDVCFENNMFHIAVENSKNINYFTEKIVDSFITKTIPIYWGCHNIGDYFDSRGFFTFGTEDECVSIVNSLTEYDYYSRKEYIDNNYQKAIYYAEYFMRCKKIIADIIKINNI